MGRLSQPQLVFGCVIVSAGVVLASLDLFIVNVALPQMARDFELRGDDVADLSWVLNAYAIVYASLLVLFGRGGGALPARARRSCSASPSSSPRRPRAERRAACRCWSPSASSRRPARRC